LLDFEPSTPSLLEPNHQAGAELSGWTDLNVKSVLSVLEPKYGRHR
jgi:hypothetical protein